MDYKEFVSPEKRKEKLELTEIVLNNLKTSANWAKLIGICGFVLTGIVVVFGIIGSFAQTRMPDQMIPANTMNPMIQIAILLISALLSFFVYLFLYNFGCKAKRGLENAQKEDFEEGIENLKIFFKYMGILTLIGISIFALTILISIITAAAGIYG